jgi:uncharacterized membrane protein YhaH (DUF805 family)
MESFKKGLRNYTNFSERTTRKDFWMFMLFYLIFYIIAIFLDILFLIDYFDMELGLGPISGLYYLALLLPAIAIEIRRNHDANRSGWFILLPFYNIYLLFVSTYPEENDWGPVPASIAESIQNNGNKKNTSNLEAKLEEVKNLLEKGLLTEEEASTRRKKIISD